MKKISWSKPDITEEDKKAMIDVINSGWLSEGEVTTRFETELAKQIGTKHAIFLNNATAALITALLAHDVRPGDEVIVPAQGFIAPVNTSLTIGAKPVLADCNIRTLNLDTKLVEEKITEKTKAMIPIDNAGMPVDIDAFENLASNKNIILIEDAAEALGARYKGRLVGSFNHTAVFSFHMAKLCTSIEGGCIVTNNEEIAEKCRMIKNHGAVGKTAKVNFDNLGLNFRTTDVQSALGLSQLKNMDARVKHRNALAKIYLDELAGLVEFQQRPEYVTTHPWMFFPILVDARKRDKINAELNSAGVDTRLSWPAVNKQKYHRNLFANEKYPNAEEIGGRIITIPIGNGITEEDAHYVAETVKKVIVENT